MFQNTGAVGAVIHRSERGRTEAATSSYRTWPTCRSGALLLECCPTAHHGTAATHPPRLAEHALKTSGPQHDELADRFTFDSAGTDPGWISCPSLVAGFLFAFAVVVMPGLR